MSAPFARLNQHLQSILFGGALLEYGIRDTFVSLFTQFQRCMFDKPLIAIITNRDVAIYWDVEQVFPDDIDIARGTLGNMSLSIFKDNNYVILTLTRFIRDG